MMRSLVLIPYCPLPINTGAKVEMWKHLDILKELGACTIVSARGRPVGLGWTLEYEQNVRDRGFELVFRDDHVGPGLLQVYGYFYGLICKGLGLDQAFGHSNPYHRHAFPAAWWQGLTKQVDLAVINYSYWAHLPCACPKVVVLHDLVSQVSWEGARRETRDLGSADLVVVISRDEEIVLNGRGISKILWSPPMVAAMSAPLTPSVGLVGSGNQFNIQGLRWLEQGLKRCGKESISIRVYGDLAKHVRSREFIPVGHYDEPAQPYKDCGIILMPTATGTGVQIKAVEALAAGRAIIARKGAMRGLPPGEGAWIEEGAAEEMLRWIEKLQNNELRQRLAEAAKAYYQYCLEAKTILRRLGNSYSSLVAAGSS